MIELGIPLLIIVGIVLQIFVPKVVPLIFFLIGVLTIPAFMIMAVRQTGEHAERKERHDSLHLRQKVAAELWLYKRAMVAGLVFIGLNAIDGYLTNYAYHMAAGMTSMEANPFIQPFLGHWVLGFKGVIGLGIIGLLAWTKGLSPDRLFRWIVFGCIVFTGIIIWNMYALGMIG